MSGAPIPAPRNLTGDKKPIPAPRQLIPIRPSRAKDRKEARESQDFDSKSDKTEFNSNTFTKRVRTLSNASKQIAEDIGGKVQESGKAVIETTRSSVRRALRRFNSTSNEQPEDEQIQEENNIDVGIFDSISFNSPITLNHPNDIDDDYNTPPPPYPPPPLPEGQESLYDAPQSLASGSTDSSSSSNLRHPEIYESVFPLYPYNSDSESCVDVSNAVVDGPAPLDRCESWRFYDQVPKVEQLYGNIDSTPSLYPDNASVTGTMRTNSLYENHDIQIRQRDETARVTESVIMQFDPLQNFTETTYANEPSDNLSALNDMFFQDLYSNTPAQTIDDLSISNESAEEYISPPPPPERFDSLPDEPEASPLPVRRTRESKSSWYTSDSSTNNNNNNNNNNSTKPLSIGMNLFKQVNTVFKKAPQLVRGSKTKESYLQRPALSTKSSIQQKGLLYKVTNGPVEDLFGEFNSRWCTLENESFLCHSDNTCNTVKENFALDSVLSIQLLEDQKYKYKYDNDDIHCFELNISGKSRGGHIYGSKSQTERRVWMQKLAESLTSKFSSKITSDFQRMGWAYVREGVSGQWAGAWVILSGRYLYYAFDNSRTKTVDLRKARCIIVQPVLEEDGTPKTTDKGPNMLVDSQSGSVYFRMWTGRETKVWCHITRLAAHNNGLHLDQQQLTKNDVPVIVEKCINFIYVYGSMTKGIYRCAGSSSNINEILTQFRTDAWSTQLTPDKYTEHDVATALKRFFRDLPEPLIMKSQQQYFHQVCLMRGKTRKERREDPNRSERIRMYRAVFDDFPKVSVNTIRTLLNHLLFIASQKDKNLMDLENISSVWGMTLMKSEIQNNESYTHKDSELVADLVDLCRYIFPENQQDIEKERMMLSVLQKYNNQTQATMNSTKASGDFRLWIYLNSKQGKTYNIAIGPQRTAYEVCAELSSKMKLPVDRLILEEMVLNETLRRPIHHTEKVLDIVLKWSYWDDADKKDNCLVITNIEKYEPYFSDKVYPVNGELRYADTKSRNFRVHMFDFTQAKLSYYKDKACHHVVETWKIEDIVWYFGCDSKRTAPFKHNITFLRKDDKPKRSKSCLYFGNTISWADESLQVTWIASMWRAAHANNFLPPPQHVSILDS